MAQETLQATVPSVAANATADQVIGEVRKAGRVVLVSYTPEAAITGAASTASRTFTVVNKGGDGLGTTTVATLAMVGGVDAVAFDELPLTLGVAANCVVAAGDVLVFVSTAVTGAAGLADPGGRVQIQTDAAGYTTTEGAGGAVTHTQT